MKQVYVSLFLSVVLLFGILSVTTGAAAASPAINITVNDSSNGQDTENISIDVATETPSWVADSGLTAAQYNAFDTGESGLTDAEVRAGIQTYVENSISGDGEIEGVAFNDDEIRTLISGYIQSQLG